jgi:hypothetical protein
VPNEMLHWSPVEQSIERSRCPREQTSAATAERGKKLEPGKRVFLSRGAGKGSKIWFLQGHPPWAPPRSPVRGIGAMGKSYNFGGSEKDRGSMRHIELGLAGLGARVFAKCPIR